MFDIDKRLRAIYEGATLNEGDTNKNWYEDNKDPGGIEDQMYMSETDEAFLYQVESGLFESDTGISAEPLAEGTTLFKMLFEVTEEEIRADVEKKRTKFQKFKEAFKRFMAAPFDPYGGLKELKAVNELIKDDMSVTTAFNIIPILGFVLTVINRAKKYNKFPEATARQYVAEAEKHKQHLNKIASNLEKESDKKYKKAAKRVRSQISKLESLTREFERRALDKATV